MEEADYLVAKAGKNLFLAEVSTIEGRGRTEQCRYGFIKTPPFSNQLNSEFLLLFRSTIIEVLLLYFSMRNRG